MAFVTDLLNWQETMNSVTVDCSLDIAIHPAESDTVLLIIPGVDGSVNGHEDKYIRIAEQVQDERQARAVLSMIAEPNDPATGIVLAHHGGVETLRLIQADGSLAALFQRHFGAIADRAGLARRRLISLDYPASADLPTATRPAWLKR